MSRLINPKGLLISALFLVACDTDKVGSPAPRFHSAILDAQEILARAEIGTLGRGEQDFLISLERQIPGFGGVFIRDGVVYAYLKGNSAGQSARAVLARAFGSHVNPRVRQAMANVGSATILPADYSLSELVAIEERIVNGSGTLPEWSGSGVSIRANRIRVTFASEQAVSRAQSLLEALGVPRGALQIAVAPRMRLASEWDDHISPVGGGIQIASSNDSKRPGQWVTDPFTHASVYRYPMSAGSLGFIVKSAQGIDYFMTAGHLVNTFYAENGVVGDTIWQPVVGAHSVYQPLGFVAVNPAWNQGDVCPTIDDTPSHYDFCTTADVLLGTFRVGETFVRKVGTSTTGGVNGAYGSKTINGFYTINGVLSPEYVNQTLMHDANKSGMVTGTTSGDILVEMGNLPVDICMPDYLGCTPSYHLLLRKVTEVSAASEKGDSGAPVFTGNPNQGAPYAAMGILVASGCCSYVFARWDLIESRLGLGALNPQTTIP